MLLSVQNCSFGNQKTMIPRRIQKARFELKHNAMTLRHLSYSMISRIGRFKVAILNAPRSLLDGADTTRHQWRLGLP